MASFRSHQGADAIFLMTVVLGLCTPAGAVEFAGGTGEPNNPYQIATAEQLIAIGSDPNLLDKHFALVADIDLDPNLPGGRIFDRPIISPGPWIPDAVVFTGRFDGRGHTVSRLRIVSARSDLGLFGVVGHAGVVQDLRLKDVNVVVTKDTAGSIGSLVGFNWGVVERCEATGVLSDYRSVGGLVGLNEGTIRECSFTGAVSGDWPVGGLIGSNRGVVVDCYCNGSVTGRFGVGGLVGSHAGALMRGYATGPVTATQSHSGGLAGGNARVIADSYFRDAASGGGPDNGCGVPLSEEQIRQRASFAGWDFADEPNDGSRDTWYMPEGGPPVLSWQADRSVLVWLPGLAGTSADEASAILARAGLVVGRVTYDWDPVMPADKVVAANPAKPVPPGTTVDLLVSRGLYDWQANPGDGSPANPYRIDTPSQLTCLDHRFYRGESFVLTCDIDLTGREYHDSVIATPFRGSFDGRGHRVTGLTIITAAEYVGLFGMIERRASVMNLVLDDAFIVGKISTLPRCGIGALAGESDGLISACGSADGQVIGGSDVGGLVGHSYGTIEGCYARGFVMGVLHTGGLVGFSNEVITDSYVQGRVVGYMETGGLAGGSGGAVHFCYALGSVTSEYSPPRAGGLLGSSWSMDDPVSSYFLAPEDGGGPDNKLGVPLTLEQMMQQASFAGWDFVGETANGSEDIWKIAEGLDYPRLAWEKYSGGTGEPNDPYQIATPADLIALGATPADYDKHFIQVTDIDLDPNLPGGKVFDRALIAPDVNDLQYNFQGMAFTGAFDGDGHVVSNLTIADPNRDCLGLFGMIAVGGRVSNLALADAEIHGGYRSINVGTLAGYNAGTLADCSATGIAIGCGNVRELAGSNSGAITDCHADVRVSWLCE